MPEKATEDVENPFSQSYSGEENMMVIGHIDDLITVDRVSADFVLDVSKSNY